MKKLTFIFAIILFAIFITACEERDQEVLRVGMDLRFPPFETENENDEPIGISVDVAKAFGEYLNRPVEIVNTNFSSLIPALNSGEIDIIIASMSNTAERALAIDFSETYFYFKIPSLVNLDFANEHGLTEDSTIEDILAVNQALINAEEPSVRFTGIVGQISSSHPESLGLTVEIATTLETAVLNVVQGQADILMMSTFPVARGFIANPDQTMIIWDAWISSPIGMGVRKGETELLEQANAFIQAMDEEGGLYDQLRDKWAYANLDENEWDEAILFVLERFGLDFFINEN
jgi:polar amino acid transport system substrate-binding protein